MKLEILILEDNGQWVGQRGRLAVEKRNDQSARAVGRHGDKSSLHEVFRGNIVWPHVAALQRQGEAGIAFRDSKEAVIRGVANAEHNAEVGTVEVGGRE